jgi:tRNA(Ile)-lysidine synthase TilS/MesJ
MSFKEHLLNEKILIDLIRRHDDPMEFAAAAIKAQREKKLNLKRRGMANTRELVRAWDKSKKKQNQDKTHHAR